MNVLVTGATGFVGSWLTKRLIALGHNVRILTRSKNIGSFLSAEPLDIALGDVTNSDSVVSATRDIHTVFHLAGLIGYSPSMRQDMTLTNVVGTANVIDAVQKSKCEKLVYMSSVVTIGAGKNPMQILNETSEYNISDLNLGYFETKRRAEQLVQEAVHRKLIDAVMINPSTIYGHGDAKKGSRKTQLKVAQGKFPFYTPGGVSIVHIEDVIDALISVWSKGKPGERYIVSGENILIEDLFKMIANEAGVKAPPLFLPKPAVLALGHFGELLSKVGLRGPISIENAWTSVLFHWFDNSKAKRELGFKPRPARAAIHDSVLWMKENHLI